MTNARSGLRHIRCLWLEEVYRLGGVLENFDESKPVVMHAFGNQGAMAYFKLLTYLCTSEARGERVKAIKAVIYDSCPAWEYDPESLARRMYDSWVQHAEMLASTEEILVQEQGADVGDPQEDIKATEDSTDGATSTASSGEEQEGGARLTRKVSLSSRAQANAAEMTAVAPGDDLVHPGEPDGEQWLRNLWNNIHFAVYQYPEIWSWESSFTLGFGKAPLVPALFLYSEDDADVNPTEIREYSQRLEKLSKHPVMLISFEASSHCQHLNVYPDIYSAQLKTFLDTYVWNAPVQAYSEEVLEPSHTKAWNSMLETAGWLSFRGVI
ncbi:hypothetical protein CYMTET_10779 [Cymbomonas tetramitiformis]|uniref:Uncharacterized protein n=1 Tax=Cymbomonas tetramitiformis TaxID=36881 RepID=A0AAE0GNI0_9CHLO|nr:hypothetical protein CYMTET_10779 [Cymbomonas tetramitiformis]